MNGGVPQGTVLGIGELAGSGPSTLITNTGRGVLTVPQRSTVTSSTAGEVSGQVNLGGALPIRRIHLLLGDSKLRERQRVH